jgi:hypothetical protein
LIAGNFGQTNKLYLNDGSASPFATTGTGSDISADDNLTLALALVDVDGDGDLDLIAGNFNQTNKLYLHTGKALFNIASAKAASIEVDAQASIIDAIMLASTQTTPLHTSIDYYLSNNGGVKWHQVQVGKIFTFPTMGSDLRWRANLTSLSPILSPHIDQLTLVKPELTLSIVAASVTEGDGAAATTATVSRNTDTTMALTVNLSSNDISKAVVPASVIIPANQVSAAFDIGAVDDVIADGTITVTITAIALDHTDGVDSLNVVDNDFDFDMDGVLDHNDNCPYDINADQADFEGDGLGDVCDYDDDGDGMSDSWELEHGLNPRNSFDRDADADADGFSNGEEYDFRTDPNVADTGDNNNGIPDAAEVRKPSIAPIIQLILLSD